MDAASVEMWTAFATEMLSEDRRPVIFSSSWNEFDSGQLRLPDKLLELIAKRLVCFMRGFVCCLPFL